MYGFHMDVSQPVTMYHKVLEQLKADGNQAPADRLMHLCSETDTGFRVTEVWTSHEACDRFGETVMRPTVRKVAGEAVLAAGPPANQEFNVQGLILHNA
jgi:hypothetical protein